MYNDYELLYLAQENNEDAVNELRKKYNSLLYAKALSYSRSSHIDIKELLNETELAFYKAIDNYIDKNTFNTYLNKVIDNNLTNYIAKHNVTKNKILNESISYENNNERILELESNKYNPEVNLFNDYDYSSLRNKIIEVLTWEEELIFTSKSSPMLFKLLKPLKEDKDFKEDSAITLKFPPIVSRLSNPSKDSKE